MVIGAVVERTTQLRPITPHPPRRGRHWPVDVQHNTGAIPIVQKETLS